VTSFFHFTDDFPGAKEVALATNYRSTQTILDAASALMEKKKALKGVAGIGEPIHLSPCRTEFEEAEMIVEQIEKLIGGTSYFSVDSGRTDFQEARTSLSFGDIAVLFRLNAQGDALEQAVSRAGIPFVRSGEKPLTQRYPVDMIWRFLQTLAHPENSLYSGAYLSLLRKYDLTPSPLASSLSDIPSSPLGGENKGGNKGGGGQKVIELIDQAVAMHGFEELLEDAAEALRRLKELAHTFGSDVHFFLDTLSLERGIDHAGLLGDRVALMSLHAAKGLEWPVVFISGCEDQLLPCTLFGDHDEAEEKRLFYVGMTRAQSRLILSHAERRSLNGRPLDMKPSPFTLLIPQHLRRPLERKPWKPKKTPPNQLQLF
jgi:DNA helicase-2/ATP-dependent DNA helicase PcrA